MTSIINDAECGVIGGLLLFPQETTEALTELCEEDFSLEPYRDIYRISCEILKENPQTDGVAILTAVKNKDKDLAVTAMRCMELFLTMANFSSYVSIVKRESRKRKVNHSIQQILLSGTDDPYSDLEKTLEEHKMVGKSTMQSKVMEYADRLYNPGKVKKIYTGLSVLDRTLGGMMAGTFSIVGARPSTGKTAFALNVIKNQLAKGNRCLMFSLEMSAGQIFDRLCADMLGINYSDIVSDNLSKECKDKMVQALAAITESGLIEVVDDVYNVEEVPSKIAEIKPDFVVVDFIQNIKAVKKFNIRRNEIDYISSELKRAAKRYNCHVMGLSQISRGGLDAPRMSDLKESGALEQDGDYVMLLHRQYVLEKDNPSVYPEDAMILLDKNKYGRTGMKRLHFDGEHQRFTEVTNFYE